MHDKQLKDIQDQFLSAVKNESEDILSSIQPISSLSSRECIDIYVRGYGARLTEALGETFQAVWWILGDEDFFKITTEYIIKNPSNVFDLSDYGANFPQFLSSNQNTNEIIGDLAAFEWFFKETFHKKNVDPTELNLVAAMENIENVRFNLSESAFLFSSVFPIYEIWQRRTEPVETLDNISWAEGENIILYKKNSQVFVKKMNAQEFFLIQSLSDGQSLGETLQSLMEKFPTIDATQIQSYFALISQLGVFNLSLNKAAP